MGWIAESWTRLRSTLRRGAIERGLDEEIRFHLDQQAAKLRHAGLNPEDARRQARLKFGGLEGVKERTRDEVRPALIEDAIRDARYGVRALVKAPAFTAAALVTLALGIGATSAIFSIVRTVMLEPLPYQDPERIVAVWETNRGGTVRNVIAPANFVAWRERTRTLEHLGMVGQVTPAMLIDGQPETVSGFAFSTDVFRAMGVQPMLGRAFTPEEDFSDNRSVMILGHEFWQRRLGGRADVLGLTLTAEGQRRTVIGVMPPSFTIVGQKADFLIPYADTIEQMRAARGRANSYGIARLGPGVTFEQAASEMKRIYADLEREFPQRNARRTVVLMRLQEQMVGELKPAVLALVAAVVLVLLVACVNVANLLLARSASRARELGLRTALGARRGRLVRQMLMESLVLGVAGGLGGLAVAAWCHRGLLALVGDRIPLPRLDQLTLDAPVVAFTMITALVTGLLFGLVPAFVSTEHATDALRDAGRHGGGRRLRRALSALVVGEVALSLVLLAGAGLLMRSFLKLQNADPGFRSGGVLTALVQLPRARYNPTQANTLFSDALPRLAALPGVERAAAASCPPMPGSCIGTSFWRADLPKPPDGQLTSGQIRPISQDFFKTLAIPQVAGRDFTASDTVDSTPVAIVSEALAKRHYGAEDPLGHRIRVNVSHTKGDGEVEWTIVGVVGNIKSSLDGTARETIYLPAPQLSSLSMRFFVRTRQDPISLASSVREVVRAVDPEAPVEISTLDDVIGSTIARPRAISTLVGVFAIVALALAAVGVYGVMAYSVRQRTQEIGVRMALGASAGSVLRLVLSQALRLAGIGVVAGLIAASLLTRLLEGLLFDVTPLDPWTFAITATILLAVSALASYLPARRGMRMAPLEALRTN